MEKPHASIEKPPQGVGVSCATCDGSGDSDGVVCPSQHKGRLRFTSARASRVSSTRSTVSPCASLQVLRALVAASWASNTCLSTRSCLTCNGITERDRLKKKEKNRWHVSCTLYNAFTLGITRQGTDSQHELRYSWTASILQHLGETFFGFIHPGSNSHLRCSRRNKPTSRA